MTKRAYPGLTLFAVCGALGCSAGTTAPLDAGSVSSPDGQGRATPDAAHAHDARLPHDAAVDATSDATGDALVSQRDAPQSADALSGTTDATSGSDATSPIDTGVDAGACTGARNILTLQAASSFPFGDIGTLSLMNLDSLWQAGTSPYEIVATPGSGASVSLEFDLPYGQALVPGTYPQGGALRDGGVALNLVYDGTGCAPTSGTLHLDSLTTDDGGITAAFATFSLACGLNGTGEVSGCVRYQAQLGGFDAGVSPDAAVPDAAADAGTMAPCMGSPQAFYVAGLLPTPVRITGAEGNWSGGQSGDVMLTVQASQQWALSLGGPIGESLTPGMTYTGAGILPSAPADFALLADGVDCAQPDATFTVYAYADTGGDDATVTELAASFTTTCGGKIVTGCVRYSE